MTHDLEYIQRAALVTTAASWIGTPYRHMGRVKGRTGGVDCIMLIAESFAEAGLIERPALPHYPQDWHLHRGAERYLAGLLRYTEEIPMDAPPQPGDVALWRFGRCFSHGAIVVEWPRIVHAYIGQGCVAEDVSRAPWFSHTGEPGPGTGKPRLVRFFSFWQKDR